MHMSEDDEVAALEEALVGFFAAYRRSRSRLQRDPGLVGLTNAQFAVLEAVITHGDKGVGAVAAACGMTQPPATRAIARLAAKELIERRGSADDGRVSQLVVTPAGRRLLVHHRQRLHRAAQTLHDKLPPASYADAAGLLDLLGAALDELP
jgi:DNA-binding MarR family transcriptional regulator